MGERIERTYSTPDGCDLVVENVKGQITVEGWDRPETEVVATYDKWAEIEISQDGRKVIARTKTRQGGINGLLDLFTRWHGAFDVDYVVHVPYASNLKLKNVNGPVNASQVRGEVDLSNVDGPATIEAIAGQVKAETVNGPLQVKGFEGTGKLKTVNGKLQVSGGNLDDLAAETVNGQIEVEAALDPTGRYHFNTVNGSCHLVVPSDLRARVSAHGINSSVHCARPAQSVERHFGTWQGIIGEGDGPLAEIAFHTVNGSLRIDNGEPVAQPRHESVAHAAPPKPPEPPVPPTTHVEVKTDKEPVEVKVAGQPAAGETAPKERPSQKQVLEMVERGELSVEEAVKLLQG